jgi:hypothetical protein
MDRTALTELIRAISNKSVTIEKACAQLSNARVKPEDLVASVKATPEDLSALIERNGWTQDDAAKYFEKDRKTIQRWLGAAGSADKANHSPIPADASSMILNITREDRERLLEACKNEPKTSKSAQASEAMTTLNDFTSMMGPLSDTYKALSINFFDKVVEFESNLIDRMVWINIADPSLSPDEVILVASTAVLPGREVPDAILLEAVREVLARVKPDQSDTEAAFGVEKYLVISLYFKDNRNYKAVFISTEKSKLAFQASVDTNVEAIGARLRKHLSRLRLTF